MPAENYEVDTPTFSFFCSSSCSCCCCRLIDGYVSVCLPHSLSTARKENNNKQEEEKEILDFLLFLFLFPFLLHPLRGWLSSLTGESNSSPSCTTTRTPIIIIIIIIPIIIPITASRVPGVSCCVFCVCCFSVSWFDLSEV